MSSSPFTILGVSSRATHDAVVSAAEDRIFDGIDATILEDARNSLTIPRERVNAELRFFPDISPARLDGVIRELQEAENQSEVDRVLNGLPALTRINLLVDLLRSDVESYLPIFCVALSEFDPHLARQAIDENRTVSQFRSVQSDEWRDALQSYQAELAEELFQSVISTPSPSTHLIDLLNSQSLRDGEWFSSTLDGAIDRYDRWSETELSKIQSRLTGHIELASNGRLDDAISSIESDLEEWDLINQPVQLRDEARGLDEPKSRKVFEQVRDLALKLANQDGRYSEAKRLSEALKKTFPELPSVLVRLEQDIETLDELIAHSNEQKLLEPLISAVARTKENLATTARWVEAGHFSERGQGDVGALFSAHSKVIVETRQSDLGDLPWRITRSVALDLSNEASEPLAAKIILEAIKPGAPASILPLIDQDLSVLERLILQGKLSSAMQAEDWDLALASVTQLINIDPSNREDWAKLQTGLQSKISSRNRGRWFWGFVGIAVLISLLSDCTKDRSFEAPYDSDYSYSESQSVSVPEDASGTSGAVDDGSPAEDAEDQRPGLESLALQLPAAGAAYSSLSRSELRYCMFEERKISYLEPRVRPADYDEYNLRIDDFNDRCENRRYYVRDQSSIRSEINLYGTELDAEAQQILESWQSRNSYPIADQPAVGTDPYLSGDNDARPTRGDSPIVEDDYDDDPLAPLEQGDESPYEY